MKTSLTLLLTTLLLSGCSDEPMLEGEYREFKYLKDLSESEIVNCKALDKGEPQRRFEKKSLWDIRSVEADNGKKYILSLNENWLRVKAESAPTEYNKENNTLSVLITGEGTDRNLTFNYTISAEVLNHGDDKITKLTKVLMDVNYPDKPSKDKTIDFLKGDSICGYDFSNK